MMPRVVISILIAAVLLIIPAGPATGMPGLEGLQEAHGLLSDWEPIRAEEALRKYLEDNPGNATAHYLTARAAFDVGDYQRALDILEDPEVKAISQGNDFPRLARDTAEAVAALTPHASEHFVIYVDEERDWVLAEPGLAALERGREKLGEIFGFYPGERVRVEMIPDADTFQKVSSLSIRDIEVSGAIGICKFNKIMLVSPRTLLRGYRWMDSLIHEYIHYMVVRLTGNEAPIWVHEGTAKYFERAWKTASPGELWPLGASVLAGAMEGEYRIIPFEEMDPSLVKLNSSLEVTLAFAECAAAVDMIISRTGREGLIAFLDNIGKMGRARTREALKEVVRLDFEEFEEAWKEHVKGMGLVKMDHIRLKDFRVADGPEDDQALMAEIQALAGRSHLKLGDKFRKKGRLKPALIEYKRAYRESPGSPYIINKVAIAAALLEDYETSLDYVERALKISPDYPLTYQTAGDSSAGQGEYDRAVEMYREYREINPYNPEVYKREGLAHLKAGRKDEALAVWEQALRLRPGDRLLQKQIADIRGN